MGLHAASIVVVVVDIVDGCLPKVDTVLLHIVLAGVCAVVDRKLAVVAEDAVGALSWPTRIDSYRRFCYHHPCR